MQTTTICAVATAPGGALGVVRVAGADAIAVTDRIFRSRGGKPLADRRAHSLAFGQIVDPQDGTLIDEVLVSVFRAPHSYTGEDATEISCHGSAFVLHRVVQLLMAAGATPAEPGEFTRRAFLNGKMDLSQAEAVADLIASSTAASHRVAMSQMRGHFSQRLAGLRDQLLHLTSLLELELDFSDHEDLEFADRSQLDGVAAAVEAETARLANSFSTGNALREGWPVAIVGATNAGKSTLLNALLQDDRAIVSDVHGTTRDVVEDTFVLGGVLFRFIDTAGLRDTTDQVEQMGIERSRRQLHAARTVIFVLDVNCVETQLATLAEEVFSARNEGDVLVVVNKADCLAALAGGEEAALSRSAAAVCSRAFPATSWHKISASASTIWPKSPVAKSQQTRCSAQYSRTSAWGSEHRQKELIECSGSEAIPPYLLKIFLQIIDENLVFGHRYGLPRYFSFGKCAHHDRKRNGVYL